MGIIVRLVAGGFSSFFSGDRVEDWRDGFFGGRRWLCWYRVCVGLWQVCLRGKVARSVLYRVWELLVNIE